MPKLEVSFSVACVKLLPDWYREDFMVTQTNGESQQNRIAMKSLMNSSHLEFILCILLSGLTSCESKVEIRTTKAPTESRKGAQPSPDTNPSGPSSGDPAGGGTTGRVEPIEIPGALSANRDYFQTRSIMTLKIAPESVETGDLFSLFNTSTNEQLVDPRALALGTNDTSGEPFSLSTSGVQVFVSLYLLDPNILNKFSYGSNNLRLDIESATPKTAYKTVYLRDFKLLGTQASHFTEMKQRVGGFQGEVSVIRRPVLKAGPNVMTQGFLMMVNQ